MIVLTVLPPTDVASLANDDLSVGFVCSHFAGEWRTYFETTACVVEAHDTASNWFDRGEVFAALSPSQDPHDMRYSWSAIAAHVESAEDHPAMVFAAIEEALFWSIWWA